MQAFSGKGEGAKHGWDGAIHTKHPSINQTAALPNPAGSRLSPAGKQELTRSERSFVSGMLSYLLSYSGMNSRLFVGKAGGTQDHSWESPRNAERAEEKMISRGWNGGDSSPMLLPLTAANFAQLHTEGANWSGSVTTRLLLSYYQDTTR